MQILHCNFKDREPRLKIDARIACTLDSHEDLVTGLRIFVTRIKMVGIPEKQKHPKMQFLSTQEPYDV